MSKEKAQAIAVKHSELADIQGHGEMAVLTLEQATRAILEYSSQKECTCKNRKP